MHLVRTFLVAGLLVAALAGPVAQAQEAIEITGEEIPYVESEAMPTADEVIAEPQPIGPEAILAGEPIVAAESELLFAELEQLSTEPVALPSEPVALPEAPVAAPTPVPTAAVAPQPSPTAAPTPAPAAPKHLNLTVVDNRFQPSMLAVEAGTTVTWTNMGSNLHTLTSADGLFESGALQAGQSFTYTFAKAGNYTLLCRQHTLNGMSGRVSVQ